MDLLKKTFSFRLSESVHGVLIANHPWRSNEAPDQGLDIPLLGCCAVLASTTLFGNEGTVSRKREDAQDERRCVCDASALEGHRAENTTEGMLVLATGHHSKSADPSAVVARRTHRVQARASESIQTPPQQRTTNGHLYRQRTSRSLRRQATNLRRKRGALL